MIKEYFKLDKFGNPMKVPKCEGRPSDERHKMFLASTTFNCGDMAISISTIFTGEDWNTGKEKHVPYLWETSINGTDLIPEQRYQTQADAIEGHVKTCYQAMVICMESMNV